MAKGELRKCYEVSCARCECETTVDGTSLADAASRLRRIWRWSQPSGKLWICAACTRQHQAKKDQYVMEYLSLFSHTQGSLR